MSRFLILLGAFILIIGFLYPFLQKLGLGKLPGDMVFSTDNFIIYFPFTISIICSLILTLISWLVKK